MCTFSLSPNPRKVSATWTGYFPSINDDGRICTRHNNLKLGVCGLVIKHTFKIFKILYPSPIARNTVERFRLRQAKVIVVITDSRQSDAKVLMLVLDKVVGIDLIIIGLEHKPLPVMVKHCAGDDGEESIDCSNAVDEHCIRHKEGGIHVLKCELGGLNSCLL